MRYCERCTSGERKQWDEKASEHEIEAAAIKLCHAYKPARKQFDAFINDILVAIVNSLQPKSERFSPPQSTKLGITPPVLFVEEFGPSANRLVLRLRNQLMKIAVISVFLLARASSTPYT